MTSRTAAIRYATALFDVVLREAGDGAIETAHDEVRAFSALVQANETLAHALANPAVPAPRKHAVVQALLERAPGVSAPVRKLLLVLADRDRLVLLPEVVTAYRERLMDYRKVIRGEVTTAVPLPHEKLAALEAGFGRVTGRRVELGSRVDPSILGGAVTRLGSTVYDGSVTTQLQRLKESLIDSAQ